MGRDLHGTDSDEISSRSGMNIAVDSGSVEWVANPKLENNTVENEAAIVVFPNDGSDGYISGKYPKRSIQAGDWFRAVIGCMYDSPQCNVTFKLDYQVDGDSVKNLGKWTQTYDGKIQHIDVDLSFLAGKNVVFILTVQNNGSNLDDNAFWLLPRIAR
jgi:hypothetical protein